MTNLSRMIHHQSHYKLSIYKNPIAKNESFSNITILKLLTFCWPIVKRYFVGDILLVNREESTTIYSYILTKPT
jgi:hypothetical protein